MTLAKSDVVLALLSIALVTFAVARWSEADTASAALVLPRTTEVADASIASSDDLLAIAGEVVERNPFRLSNRPSLLRHGDEIKPESPRGPAYRPTLSLNAIVGGPPWRALVTGVPGRTGASMLSQGDLLDSLEVRMITRDSIVLRGPDTTWVLTVHKGRPE